MWLRIYSNTGGQSSKSLKSYLPEVLEKAYQDGIDLAVRETSINYKNFLAQCPYSLEQVLNLEFFSGEEFYKKNGIF